MVLFILYRICLFCFNKIVHLLHYGNCFLELSNIARVDEIPVSYSITLVPKDMIANLAAVNEFDTPDGSSAS